MSEPGRISSSSSHNGNTTTSHKHDTHSSRTADAKPKDAVSPSRTPINTSDKPNVAQTSTSEPVAIHNEAKTTAAPRDDKELATQKSTLAASAALKRPKKIVMKLGIGPKKACVSATEPPPMKKPSVQAQRVFDAGSGSDDEGEPASQMPEECRMRMRNIGRQTPTSAGPNSFLKTKQGFQDRRFMS